MSLPGSRAPDGIAAQAGGELRPRRELLTGNQLAGDTLKLPPWVLLEEMDCREGHGGQPDKDPSRTEEKSGHRGQTQCYRGQRCCEASGLGEAGQKLQDGKEGESQGKPLVLGFELGSVGPYPRALPVGHIILPSTTRIHDTVLLDSGRLARAAPAQTEKTINSYQNRKSLVSQGGFVLPSNRSCRPSGGCSDCFCSCILT